jgi:protocatechuate 3,4-dioxygenase beta subunit
VNRYPVLADNRRRFLRIWGALPVLLGLPAWSGVPGEAQAQELPPTPACSDGDEPTPRQMEGPFFKPSSPLRTSLLDAGTKGTTIVLTGLVLSTRCKPVSGALLDFWQCDDSGDYDNGGYRLRGHQLTDSAGRYRLETIVPAVYPGRTRHIHVKLQAPGRPVLTTQIYFPGEPRNEGDFLFRRELLMAMKETDGAKAGRFDFVVKVG